MVATFAPHHGFPHGAIGLIDRGDGPEGPEGKGFTYITREFAHIGDSQHEWSYRDPFPLGRSDVSCAATAAEACTASASTCWTPSDRKRLLYEDPRGGLLLSAGPAARRPCRREIPPRVERFLPDAAGDTPTGRPCVLVDVYRGLEPAVKRGRVKYLRIMEQVRKTEDLRGRGPTTSRP